MPSIEGICGAGFGFLWLEMTYSVVSNMPVIEAAFSQAMYDLHSRLLPLNQLIIYFFLKIMAQK